MTLQGALRRRGVQARTAATVDEGLVSLEDAPVDLVVVDYRMPRVDGLSALPRLRRLCPEGAIVMLTGFGDIPLEGADTLLTTPIDADRLLREATALFERPRAVSTPSGSPASLSTYKLEELER